MGRPSRSDRPRPTLAGIMLLIAGVGFALWLIVPDLRAGDQGIGEPELWLMVVILVLGGLSVIGPPLLLAERRRRRGTTWGPGRVAWFAQGMASWLLWPPVIVRRARGPEGFTASTSGTCYLYGTPLMAVYVACALLAGGWLRRRRLRAARRSWHERFGLLLGLAWACTGLYVLFLFYREDLKR